jgi:uncharacterized membrane protein
MKRFEFKKVLLIGLIGFVAYQSIEVTYTAIVQCSFKLVGCSSIWMGIVGAVALVILGQFNQRSPIRHYPMFIHALLGCLLITALELIAGLILNVWLGFCIWDYSGQVLNLWGQVCIQYSFYWFLACPLAFYVDDVIRWAFYRQESTTRRDQYTLLDYYKALFNFEKNIIKITRRNRDLLFHEYKGV